MSNADVPVTRYERRGRAAWITLDSPGNRNALSAPLVQELGQHLRTASIDPEVRVIVLTGAGPAFCAGADLKNRGDAVAPELWHQCVGPALHASQPGGRVAAGSQSRFEGAGVADQHLERALRRRVDPRV